MSSPVTKTPASKSERMRLALESADKMIAESQKKRREDAEKHESDMEALREQMRAALEGDKEESEDIQEVHEPRQLLSVLPLKKDAVSDSVQDEGSVEDQDSNDGVAYDFEPFVTGQAAVYKEEHSFHMSEEQVLNVPGQDTARRTSRRDTDESAWPASQDVRVRSFKGSAPKANAQTRRSTMRTTDEENRELRAERDWQARRILELERGGARFRQRSDSDELDDRIRTVRDSIGILGPSRGHGYNKQTTVEAVNSLELLRKVMKGVGQKPELDVITAENVYPWIEACQKVRGLERDVFNDYFPVLISTEAWANIQAWNAARKEDRHKKGKYWPGKLKHGVIVGRTGFTDSTKATTDNLSLHIAEYKREMDLNDVHGEGLRGVSWERVCSVLQAMIAPKKKKAFKGQLEREASRLLSKSMRDQLSKQRTPLNLLEGELVATECKAAMKTIKDALTKIQEGRRLAESYHEAGFQEIRYEGADGHESMVKSLLESWKASHALTLHNQLREQYPCGSVHKLRGELAAAEAGNGKANKIATLDEYFAIYDAYWTEVYDLGHIQETTFESYGIPFETRALQALEAGERLYTEDEVRQLKKAWKRDEKERVRLAVSANEYLLQAITAFNGKFGYKGNPICFREAGRMDPKDRCCDGLTKGGGICNGHKNRNVDDWIAGLAYMIEQTERDQVYHSKRLDHLRALRKRIQKDGASAIPKFDAHPGRDRPLQQIGYISECDEDDCKEDVGGAESDDDGQVYAICNALEDCSDSDSM